MPCVFGCLFSGACGLLWCIAWIVCVHDSPADDKNISAIEKMYIESSIGERATRTAVGCCAFFAIDVARVMSSLFTVLMLFWLSELI